MNRVEIDRCSPFGVAMDRLRTEGLETASLSSRDRFDEGAVHVTARMGGAPVGMVRITSGVDSVLHCWALGEWQLPTGPGVAELTRGVVGKSWRRYGIYRLLMLEVMAGLDGEDVHVATAAIEPDFVGRRFLESLGFRVCGRERIIRDWPRTSTLVLPIAAEVSNARRAQWATMLAGFAERLLASGLVVVRSSEGCRSSSGDEMVPKLDL